MGRRMQVGSSKAQETARQWQSKEKEAPQHHDEFNLMATVNKPWQT
jgi:hypothetical protein